MSRVKTFDATGVAPGGRLYAGDLNALQDHYADLSNFSQTVSVGVLRVGDSTLQISKPGAGVIAFSAIGRFSERVEGLKGVFGGTFTTTSRDALGVSERPTGLIIFNTTNSRLEVNKGTPSVPNWVGMASGIVDADIASGAAIAKSKLASLHIVDADIDGPISKSKLGALNIGNSDVALGAGIAVSKLAPGSDGQILKTSGSSVVWGSISGTWGGSYPALTADIGDGQVTLAKLAAGAVDNSKVANGAAIDKSKLAPLNIVNADVAGGAAIAKSKLAALHIVDADVDGPISKSKLDALHIVDADIDGPISISKLAPISPDVTSLPGSPTDGQRCRFVADADATWELAYRSTRWEFVGGTPMYFLRDAADSTSSTSWSDTFVELTAPVAGVYEVEFGGTIATAGGEGQLGIRVDTTDPIDVITNIPPNSTVIEAWGEITSIPPGGGEVSVKHSVARKIRVTTTGTNKVIKLRMRSVDGGSITFTRKWMTLRLIHT